jgi:hypothetical protein
MDINWNLFICGELSKFSQTLTRLSNCRGFRLPICKEYSSLRNSQNEDRTAKPALGCSVKYIKLVNSKGKTYSGYLIGKQPNIIVEAIVQYVLLCFCSHQKSLVPDSSFLINAGHHKMPVIDCRYYCRLWLLSYIHRQSRKLEHADRSDSG